MPARPPLTIRPEDVLEGRGLVHAADPPLPLPTSAENNISIEYYGAGSSIPTRHTTWDRSDALRQLRSALGVDAPAQLHHHTPSTHGDAVVTLSSTADQGRPISCPAPADIAGCQYACSRRTLNSLSSECAALAAWLGLPEEEEASHTLDTATTCVSLLDSHRLKELRMRARKAARCARSWQKAQEHNANPSAGSTNTRTNTTSTTSMQQLAETVLHCKEQLQAVRSLMRRYSVVQPAMDEAAVRQHNVNTLETWCSEQFSTQLRAFGAALQEFSASVQESEQTLERNVEAMSARYEKLLLLHRQLV